MTTEAAEAIDPAAMLDAALSGELNEDGEVVKPEGEQPTEQATTAEDNKPDEGDKPEGGEQASDKAGDKDSADAEIQAPIASKSGAYTIPYQKLVDARTDRDTWKQKAEQLEVQLQQMSAAQQANLAQAQQQAQERQDAGQQQTQADVNLAAAEQAIHDGADLDLFGDFSEEAIAKGIQALQDRARAEIRAELSAEMDKKLQPLLQQEQNRESAAHFEAIYKAHADADDIVESAEFASWRESLPGYARTAIDHVMTDGTTAEVIEVFDSFKKATGTGQQAVTPQKAPEVQRRVPLSLSEMAGTAPVDEVQQVLQAADNPGALLDRMASMTPEQITALMDKV